MEDISRLIVGTWRLVHAINVTANGERDHPFGAGALGYICYGETGIMAVQISRKSRQEPRDITHLELDYFAYFGRYEVDPGKHVVRHFLEGQLFPGGQPAVLERKCRFEGDLMWLTPVEATNREILWQRV